MKLARLLRAHRRAVVWTSLIALTVALTSLGLARAAAALLEHALDGAFAWPLGLLMWASARILLGALQQRASTTLGHRVATDLREALVHHVLRVDLAHMPSPPELLTRIAHDVTQVQSLVAFRAPTLLSDAGTSLVLASYAMWIAPTTCALAALPTLAALPLLVHHSRKQARAEDAARASYTKVHEHVADTLEAALVIRHHSGEAHAEASLRKTLDAFEVAALEARHRATRVAPIPQLAALASFVLVAFHMASLIARGDLGHEDALTLFIVLSLAARPLMRLASAASELGTSLASVRRVADLLALPTSKSSAISSVTSALSVHLDDIHITRANHVLLQGASLRVDRGEMVAVTGENGTGKSSLLLALAELLPHRKTLRDIDTQSEADARLDVAWVPQSPALVLGTVRSNVAMQPDADDTRCLAALARVGMKHVDLDKHVEPAGRNFSLGERHKIALARALYLERSVLVLDEPTSSLDAASTATFLATLRDLRSDHAILIVSHDQHVIDACDRVLCVASKRLAEVR